MIKGKHHSEESKKKISVARKGKQHSEEVKKKISETFQRKKNGQIMIEKKCTKCGETKKLSEFYKDKRYKNLLYSHCKVCMGKTAKSWCMVNPDRVRELVNRGNIKSRSTSKGKLNHNIGNNIGHSLRGSKAGRRWEDLVGFTVEQLKKHLEKRFEPRMTWENYGTYWEIDHKIPIAVFNFEKPEDIDFRLCWSLKNLQPLEAKKNRSKQDKIGKPFQPSLLVAL